MIKGCEGGDKMITIIYTHNDQLLHITSAY